MQRGEFGRSTLREIFGLIRAQEDAWRRQAELAAVTPYFVAAMLTPEGKKPPPFESFVIGK